MSEEKYPELVKVERIKDKSQPVGEFLEWLTTERGIILAKYHEHSKDCHMGGEDEDEDIVYTCGYEQSDLQHCYIGIEKLLAEFFNIDLDKVEKERRQLLEDVRKRGERKPE
jgi:hypothetical protein